MWRPLRIGLGRHCFGVREAARPRSGEEARSALRFRLIKAQERFDLRTLGAPRTL